MAASGLDSIFAQRFKWDKSLMSSTERANMLKTFQNGEYHHGRSVTRLDWVTPKL